MKRFLVLMSSLIVAVSIFAQSFSGQTYSTTVRESGVKISITVKFSSATRGVMTFHGSGNGKNENDKMPFSYEVSGDIINVYPDSYGDIGYFVIGNNNDILITDDYGNVVFDLKRVASGTASSGKSTGKKSGKKRR